MLLLVICVRHASNNMGIILSFQAEYLKKHVDNEKEAGKYHEQIEIADK